MNDKDKNVFNTNTIVQKDGYFAFSNKRKWQQAVLAKNWNNSIKGADKVDEQSE